MARPGRVAQTFAVLAALSPALVSIALATSVPAAASEPVAHGPDPASVDWLPELPGPRGGPFGRPLSGAERATADATVVQAVLPEVWCGEPRRADYTATEVSNGDHRYHAVYLIPADGLDRFLAFATTLQTDAMQASALLERLYGRAIRFDMGTTCGPQFLDISFVRMAQSTAQLQGLAGSAPGLFAAVERALEEANFDVLSPEDTRSAAATKLKNFLVWLDGPAPPGSCGYASYQLDDRRAVDNWNNYGGKVALVFRNGLGFCGSNTVRHELGHTLGALLPSAPHAFDGAHCDDAREDTMCYPGAPFVAAGEAQALFFDYGNDDYWDPPGGALPHWTANLNRFICPDVSCNVPGGGASGGFLDSDGDRVPDPLDNCPRTQNLDQANSGGDSRGDACEAQLDSTAQRVPPADPASTAQGTERSASGPRLRLWRRTMRVIHRGRATIVGRCGGRTVLRRSVRGPRRVRLRIRCAVRPRISVRRGPRRR